MNEMRFSGKLVELLGISTESLCGWLSGALSVEEFHAYQDHADIRKRKACINCLWQANSPDQNSLLDACDAKTILEYLAGTINL